MNAHPSLPSHPSPPSPPSHPSILQRFLWFTAATAAFIILSFTAPYSVYADDTTAPADETAQTESASPPADSAVPTDPVDDTQGPQEPTGATSTTYTYNESTGLWENDQYTWNAATNQTSPNEAPTYSYNPETRHWDTTEWIFDAASGTYVPNIISIATPPSGARLVGEEPPLKAEKTATSKDLMPQALAKQAGLLGTNTSSEVTDNNSSSGVFDLFHNAFISNNIDASAISGDALVTMNTLAGDALSGDATSIASVLSLLQSAWNLGVTGNLFTVFTQNIFGNVMGDLWLNPGSAGSSGASNSSDEVAVNISEDATIHNTITLEAVSGDATVSSNTEGGSATSGKATVIANIINAIHSSIVSGNSFLGMLNIYGNLDGDILLPHELIETLLASNAVGTLDTSQIDNASVLAEFTTTTSTTNRVNASAESGDATVASNTSAGNAATGDASTNVTLLNLTGRQVVGKNALLVFVNVLGSWVGVIVDAPAGSTSAALGGGITDNQTLEVAANANHTIVNDVDVSATSGNALVTNNTSAGDATSGSANAAVNILNMNGSQFALSDWFGILFINVFGTWNGSFGIDTGAGTLPVVLGQSGSSGPGATMVANEIKAFRFIPHDDGSYSVESSDEGVAALVQADILGQSSTPIDTLGSTTNKPKPAAVTQKDDWLFTIVMLSLGASLLGTERFITKRSAR